MASQAKHCDPNPKHGGPRGRLALGIASGKLSMWGTVQTWHGEARGLPILNVTTIMLRRYGPPGLSHDSSCDHNSKHWASVVILNIGHPVTVPHVAVCLVLRPSHVAEVHAPGAVLEDDVRQTWW